MKFDQQIYPQETQPIFSVLIPSWNNLPYLKLCVKSLKEHSTLPVQIIVHINEGADGSLDWVKNEKIDHTFTPENAGVCWSLNAASSIAKGDYISFFNDDMYVLPDWDNELWQKIQEIGHDQFFLSGTMIEPTYTGNPCIIHADYGRSVEDFQETKLLEDFMGFEKTDWSGSSWPPNVVPRKLWEKVGGYSVEFSPGMSSDPDFSRKLWEQGVRHFQGIGKSRVYHFQARSTQRIVKNNGRKQFLEKWGITQSTFYTYYLRMGKPWNGSLLEPKENLSLKMARLKAIIKRAFS